MANYCCGMRRHFVLGIVGSRANEPVPFEVMEFMPDIESKLISIKFCPFCGESLDDSQTRRVTQIKPDGN